MSTSVKKAPPPSTPGRRQSTTPNPPPSPTPQGWPLASSSTANGIGKTKSIRGSNGVTRSARATTKRPGLGPTNLSSNDIPIASEDANEDDARAEMAAVIDELKSRLFKAETASGEYQRQVAVLQVRLDESQDEHGRLEERMHGDSEGVRALEDEKRELLRQNRDLEALLDSERVAMAKVNDEHNAREEGLYSTIQRLKEAFAQRDMRTNIDGDRRLSRSSTASVLSSGSPNTDNGRFAPPSSLQPSESRNDSKLVMQKDKVIESLRLELAEAHVKLVETENMGCNHMQELENMLLETRMANARLTEDNESFQLLLSEKTLNGDFTKAECMQDSTAYGGSSGLGSLAEELESAAEEGSDNYRRLEAETRSLKDQNKALTLYIESIISRLLQHKDFETLLEKTPDIISGAPRPSGTNRRANADTDKELPPPPSEKDGEAPPSILQRARSVVAGPSRPNVRSKPANQMRPPAAPQAVTANEDPSTAPSVPLGRSQPVRRSSNRRSQSDLAYAAPVANPTYRGLPSTGSGSGVSPVISPGPIAPRNSFFAPATATSHPAAAARAASGSRAPSDRVCSSSNSTFSDCSGELDTPSPPRTNAASTNYTGAVMTQSRLRPLRLVQENREMESGGASGAAQRLKDEEEAARRKANRGSWMGWFNRGVQEGPPRSIGAEDSTG
ncbi:hypothetical protein LPUS_12056 [Lasallia pustulata]|uniref:M protein, serotype 2.1 n=1 Tax=Lasallia pustulata TaxID=136370 RepID=A0A1W5DD69_9LECA|nr:hypothetical protein LPUS_12056 [Lasallia pustulata]